MLRRSKFLFQIPNAAFLLDKGAFFVFIGVVWDVFREDD